MATITQALALAAEHHRAGRLDEAAEIYRRILAVEPRHPDALHLLGVVTAQRGDPAGGAEFIQQAIHLAPNNPVYHFNLAKALGAMGREGEANLSFRRSLELRPDDGPAQFQLGNLCQAAGEWEQAVQAFRRAIERMPENIQPRCNLGSLLQVLGRLEEAEGCHRRVVTLAPEFGPGYCNLANVLSQEGRFEESLACYRQAVQRAPEVAAIHNNLGNLLQRLGRMQEAQAALEKAVELAPREAPFRGNLGNALKEQGRIDEALAVHQQAVEIAPENPRLLSDYLLTLQYQPGITAAALAQAHWSWETGFAAPLIANAPPPPAGSKRAPLRLGFVSADLGNHPVGWLSIRVVEALARADCQTYFYSDRLPRNADPLTERFQVAATTWRWTGGLSDAALAEQIRADKIDVLFDLSGHTAGNRLLVFARRPARRQVTWLGYAGTTGLTAIDGILADAAQIPAGTEEHYRERVLRMPVCYAVYEPAEYAPPVGPLPLSAGDGATFGSLNNPAKVNDDVLRLWAEILKAVPDSRLLLKYKGFDDPGIRQRLEGRLVDRGVRPDRLILEGGGRHAEALATYGRIDLALDPFPYSGGLTTCESLWQGVPVLTLPGATFAGRHSMSYLRAVGLDEMVASDPSDYVRRAVDVVSSPSPLAELRAAMRARMEASALLDGAAFAAELLRRLGEEWG